MTRSRLFNWTFWMTKAIQSTALSQIAVNLDKETQIQIYIIITALAFAKRNSQRSHLHRSIRIRSMVVFPRVLPRQAPMAATKNLMMLKEFSERVLVISITAV